MLIDKIRYITKDYKKATQIAKRVSNNNVVGYVGVFHEKYYITYTSDDIYEFGHIKTNCIF